MVQLCVSRWGLLAAFGVLGSVSVVSAFCRSAGFYRGSTGTL